MMALYIKELLWCYLKEFLYFLSVRLSVCFLFSLMVIIFVCPPYCLFVCLFSYLYICLLFVLICLMRRSFEQFFLVVLHIRGIIGASATKRFSRFRIFRYFLPKDILSKGKKKQGSTKLPLPMG